MLWVVNGKTVLRADAWGGESPTPGFTYSTMKPQETTPGTYIVHSYAPYKTKTWPTSKIPWGTELKADRVNNRVFYRTGQRSRPWADLAQLISPDATYANLKTLFHAKYGRGSKYDTNNDGIPDVWVFNDFGPMAVRYFRDKNGSGRLDDGETLSGEMIHTTPDNEAQTATGNPVILDPSHGCVHVAPVLRDKFHKAGAFDRGIKFVIHRYRETVPPALR